MFDVTKNIFVSHYHSDAEYIEEIKRIVQKQGMTIRDSSIYEEKSKNNANNEEYIRSLIRPQINWAGTVVVLVGENTSKSDEDIPTALSEYGDALVKWNSKSIADAINGNDEWDGPQRSWNTDRVTC